MRIINTIAAGAAVAAVAIAGVGSAAAKPHHHKARGAHPAAASRLDDGKQYLSQAKISEQQAIAAAQKVASGPLNEVDLEQYAGRLVYTVDVGSRDVKVDASNGDVLAQSQDD